MSPSPSDAGPSEPDSDAGIGRFAEACERFVALCLDDPRPELERLVALRASLGALLAGTAELPVENAPSAEIADALHDQTYTRLYALIGPRYPSLWATTTRC